MSHTWAEIYAKSVLRDIDRVMQERHPGEAYEVLDQTAVAWVGWEADTTVQRSGKPPEFVVLDQIDVQDDNVVSTLRARIQAYEALINDTNRLLARYQEIQRKSK